MTAFIVAPYHDRVEIVSDGAVYTPDGVLLGTADKVIKSDVVPLAMVGSGAVNETLALADVALLLARETASVDATLAHLEHRLARASAAFNVGGLRLAIGAISESRGPVCFSFSTFDEPTSGIAAFKMQLMNRCFAQGAPPLGDDLIAYGPLSIGAGLERDAVFLMDAMRRQKMTNPVNPEREPFYSVGGHVDITTVTREGVTTRRLHTWPEDRIGGPIDPIGSPQ